MINVMLTGAGFTANFGAPLAREIYNILFNSKYVQDDEKIRKLFLDDASIGASDYESIYEKLLILLKDASDKKKELNNFFWDTFVNSLDFYSKNPQWKDVRGRKSQQSLIERFIVKFMHSKYKSIFFTLNQDMFIERQLFRAFEEYSQDNVHLQSVLNDLQFKIDETQIKNLKRLGVSDDITTMTNKQIEGSLKLRISGSQKNEAEKQYTSWENDKSKYVFYVKLHGSLDYFLDEEPLLIYGTNKQARINTPLMEFYREKFEDLLKNQTCKLFLIGYGFNDKHINDSINEFLNQTTGELHIVDHSSMNNFFKYKIEDNKNCDLKKDEIKNKLKSFHPYGLSVGSLIELIDFVN